MTTVAEMIRRDEELAEYQAEADRLIVDLEAMKSEAIEKKTQLIALGDYCAAMSTRIRDAENRLRHLEQLLTKLG